MATNPNYQRQHAFENEQLINELRTSPGPEGVDRFDADRADRWNRHRRIALVSVLAAIVAFVAKLLGLW